MSHTREEGGEGETEQNEFREVLSLQEQEEASKIQGEGAYMDVYVAHVTPRECGPLVKQLGKLSTLDSSLMKDLSHLRRVRRRAIETNDNNNTDGSSPKKGSLELHVLLTTVSNVERICATQPHLFSSAMDYLRKTYPLVAEVDVGIESVPARMAESETELHKFDQSWPTVYFPSRTKEHLERERRLTKVEVAQMREGIRAALADYLGAVVVDPTSGEVVGRAQQEDQEQLPPIGYHGLSRMKKNPLSTPVLLAIQGVSRRERQVACRIGMDNPAFQKGQYLCTGFDCYMVQEPSVFESMALVHARIRRVVFGTPRPFTDAKTGGGILSQHQVHCLPNTNHKFRAFYCEPDSELGTLCKAHLIDCSKLEDNSS